MLSEILGVPEENIATIGDMPNAVLMFDRSGFSIAMGHSGQEVKDAAHCVTASNQEDGFALAMEKYVLPRALGLVGSRKQPTGGKVPGAPGTEYKH